MAHAISAEPEDSLSQRNFERIAKLVNHHTGIQLPPSKKHMVEGRLRKRARNCGHSKLNDYCHYLLEEGGFDNEFPFVVDVMTTNKTEFFREPAHFIELKRIVPHLLASSGRTFKVWSAACSTGAEAYTIAMVLAHMNMAAEFRFAILATDICSSVLEEGRRAVYSNEMLAAVPPEFRKHYVMASRGGKGHGRIVPELRRVVRFQRLNLLDGNYPVDQDVDIIFLRNVLIYFDKTVQHRVMQHLAGHLRPGGYIFVGHSETMAASGLQLNQVAPAVFRKP